MTEDFRPFWHGCGTADGPVDPSPFLQPGSAQRAWPRSVVQSVSPAREDAAHDGAADRVPTRAPCVSRRGYDDQLLGLPEEGGIVTREEATQTEAGTRERVLKGRAGLRARLPWALDAEASSEGSTQRRDEVSLESKSARQHTAASLFNLLYEYLSSDDQLVTLSEPSQLEELRTGQLVEMAGEYLGNPLRGYPCFRCDDVPVLC